MPSLSPDNLTTIIVAFIAFGSAYFTAKFGVKKSGTDTLHKLQIENSTLRERIKEMEEELHDQRNKTALEMRHKLEAQAELEALRKMSRKHRRRS